ncbi:hypothetical protein PTNB85_10496 [Pyrenophora teres f. teres]|nr:hypothetical protein HRS9139_10460 [Pyrenophora teres f. teres]KAE8822193.1 hypothetical protein PTNB85_10496 [Pyrenophora teres f. teres]KAE8852443.1 hypothetical protein PTNB29_10464 [Pyrenophora teres f. teres]
MSLFAQGSMTVHLDLRSCDMRFPHTIIALRTFLGLLADSFHYRPSDTKAIVKLHVSGNQTTTMNAIMNREGALDQIPATEQPAFEFPSEDEIWTCIKEGLNYWEPKDFGNPQMGGFETVIQGIPGRFMSIETRLELDVITY